MRLASRARKLPWSAVWTREMSAPLAASMRAFLLQSCGRLPLSHSACEVLCLRGSGAGRRLVDWSGVCSVSWIILLCFAGNSNIAFS